MNKGEIMRASLGKPLMAAGVIALLVGALAMAARAQAPRTAAAWRGAGPTPCVGSDGGIYNARRRRK